MGLSGVELGTLRFMGRQVNTELSHLPQFHLQLFGEISDLYLFIYLGLVLLLILLSSKWIWYKKKLRSSSLCGVARNSVACRKELDFWPLLFDIVQKDSIFSIPFSLFAEFGEN